MIKFTVETDKPNTSKLEIEISSDSKIYEVVNVINTMIGFLGYDEKVDLYSEKEG